MPTDIENDTPAWLARQVRQAEAANPVLPDIAKMESDLENDGPSETDKEVFLGDEPAPVKAPKTTKKKEGKAGKSTEFDVIANELATMLASKNRKYGDSYAKMAHVLPLFYPNGVRGENLLDAVFILRIIDKLMRISSDQRDDDEDPVMDVAGYAILRMREMRSSE